LRARDLFRTVTSLEALRGARARIEGRWITLWCTNDYLGLSQHPRLIHAAAHAMARWGVGARASRLLAGSTRLHEQLEDALAAFFHTGSAVVFASGYLANLGAIPALVGRDDLILVDRLAHASLIDACRLSRATLRVFHHQDPVHVRALLARHPARRRLIVTEGIFSMDGDAAPVRALQEVARAAGAWLYLDDAHGAFAVGATGRGSPEVAGVPHTELIYMGTLSKALGAQGAFVAGSTRLIQLMQNRARTFIYATALACPVVAAASEAIRLVARSSQARAQLAANSQRLVHALVERGLVPPTQPVSHIVPIIVGSPRGARDLAAHLWTQGVFAPAIRPPTVPEGTARIRLSVSAAHTTSQVAHLVQALGAWRAR